MRQRARWRAARAVLPLLLALLAALPARAARARPAQSGQPAIAVACATDTRLLAFALDDTGAPLPPPGANATLDTGNPRLAATCQALVTLPGAADPLAVPPGSILYTVAGPGIAVESGTTSYEAACGCAGTLQADGSALAPAAGAVHIAIAPGAPLPQGPAPGAITLTAAYRSADGALEATATAAIDLAPPLVRLQLDARLESAPSGAPGTIRLTLRLQQAVPAGCVALGNNLVCADPAGAAVAGAEPGTLTLTTTLGAFASGERTLVLTCGAPPATPPVAPPPGVERPYPLACADDLAVAVDLNGRAGEATLAAAFRGFYTGAAASASTTVTVPPSPPSYPLRPGCTDVQAPIELPPAAPVALVAESVTPPEAVVAIWRRDRDGRWQLGYARDPAAPLDFATVDPGAPLTICVDRAAGYPLH